MALPAGPKSKDAQYASLPTHLPPSEFSAAVHRDPPYTWQSPLLDEVLLGSPNLKGRGTPPRVAYIQVARKNGKSRFAADVALYVAAKGGQVFLIADSERNLKSALFHELNTLVRRSPQLTAAFLLYKDHLECPATGGQISLRPNNLSASQSINPDLVIFDEVHMQKTDSIWNGMVLAGAASPTSLLLGITTPGYDVTGLAHTLYEGVKAGTVWGRIFEPEDPDCGLDDPVAIRQSNPVLDDRPDMAGVFEFERGTMPEHDYRRFRLGQWTTTATGWLPYGAWAARTAPREYEAGERLWVGFDGSYSRDSTALVACNAQGHLKVIGLWESAGKTGWRVPRQQVNDAIDTLMANYDVTLYCDPPDWKVELAAWDNAYPGRVIEFPTFSRARMGPACESLYAAVLGGTVSHDGDPALTRHVANCQGVPTPHGTCIEKSHKDSPAKIDAAVAAVLAYHHAQIAPPASDLFIGSF